MLYNDYSYYLAHHGIKGQKWGVRRFQNKDGSLTPAGRVRYGVGSNSRYNIKIEGTSPNKKVDLRNIFKTSAKDIELNKKFFGNTVDETSEEIENRNFKAQQKISVRSYGKALANVPLQIASAFDIRALAATIALSAVDTMIPKADNFKNRYVRRNNVKSLDDLPKKSRESTIQKDAENVNPKYGKIGYDKNCQYAAVTYDLRRRGYDVKAGGRLAGGKDSSVLRMYNTDKKFNKFKANTNLTESREENLKNFMEAINKEPDGSRGILQMYMPYGGHAISYEKTNGKIKFIDPQNGTVNSDYLKTVMRKQCHTFSYLRTDNLEINVSNIGEAIDPSSINKR